MNDQAETATQIEARERTVTRCDFRSSGLLSNEGTRQLRSMHEIFARSFAHSIDLFLGSPVELKLTKVDQIGAREFSATLPAGTYIVPFSLQPLQEKVVAKFDNGLLFPLLDLLLGGPGESIQETRDLTEIDEELFRSVTELMATQLERVWKVANVSVAPLTSLKPGLTGQLFAIEERIITIHFEMRLATATSGFAIAMPMSFASGLVRSTQGEALRRAESRLGGRDRLRRRVLQCEIPLSVALPELCVPVGDIVSLKIGGVLNLRAPKGRPVLLEVDGFSIFEVTPVKCSEYKAARLNKALRPEV